MNSFNKKIIIILSIFIFLAIGTTTALILIKNNNLLNNGGIDNVSNNNEEITEKGIDLNGTFNQNDIIINEITKTYNGNEVEIPQIEGLKNKEIQNKINNEISEKIDNELKDNSQLGYATFFVAGNFANVISISFNYNVGEKYKYICFNYELVNGTELKLEDLFTKDLPVIEVVKKCFYKRLVSDGRFDEQGNENYEDLLSINETEYYNRVNKFMNSENKQFSFTSSNLSLCVDEMWGDIKLIDIAENISIYNKYLTKESIFEKDDIGFKNLITCTNATNEVFEKLEYGYLEDNLWYDITIWNNTYQKETIEKASPSILEKYTQYKNNLYEITKQKIDEYREIAKENKDKVYVVIAKPSLGIYTKDEYNDEKQDWDYDVSNMLYQSCSIGIYEMKKEFFENSFKDKLISRYRYEYFSMAGGVYFPEEQIEEMKDIKVIQDKQEQLYDIMSDTKLNTLQDVFVEDSGYIFIIQDRVKEILSWGEENYSDEEIEEYIKKINCKLDDFGIKVTIPDLPDFEAYVAFGEFDKSMFKHFE